MVDWKDFEQIYADHEYEIYALLVTLLVVILLRVTPFGTNLAQLNPRRPSTMPATSPQTVKLKSTLRLLIPRLRNAQKKDTALSIAARREMADLLAQSREASARIRVENIIHTDVTVELMEILELYAELLLARAGLLDVKDKNAKDGLASGDDGTGLEEAAASIIYAAPRLARDIRELPVVRAMLVDRFGKDFALKAQENVDGIVPTRVTDKLKVDPPSEKLVTAYLTEIARTYGVDWPRYQEEFSQAEEEVNAEVSHNSHDDDDGEGGSKEQPILADGPSTAPEPKTPSSKTALNIGPLPPRGPVQPEGSKSPVSVAPPGARVGNPSPGVKLPGGEQVKAPSQVVAAKKPATGGITDGIPTVDDLAARFKQLKR